LPEGFLFNRGRFWEVEKERRGRKKHRAPSRVGVEPRGEERLEEVLSVWEEEAKGGLESSSWF